MIGKVIDLIPLILTAATTAGSVTLYLRNKLGEIKYDIDCNNEKINVLSAGLLAQFRANPHLDVERFEDALDDSGVQAEDFFLEGEKS